MAEQPGISLVPDLTTFTSGDGRVAAWGPNNSFLVTSPNANFVPDIVEGIVTVYLCDDGAFGKHDPSQWPQLYVSQFPYFTAIPKRPTTAPCPHAPIWDNPSPDDFIEIERAPVHGFGLLRPQFLEPLTPVVVAMISKARQYVPPWPSVDAHPLRQYELEMSRAWERLQQFAGTYRDQKLQLGKVRRYWLLCSAFITFYDRFCRDLPAEPLDVDHNLMGAWTSDPGVVQTLSFMGIPVWLVRAPHLVSPHIRVAKLIGMSSTEALCHVKFFGGDVVYHGLAGARHLEVTFKSYWELIGSWRRVHNASGYCDISTVPTAVNSEPSEPTSKSQSSTLRGSAASHRPGHKRKSKARYRPRPYDGDARDRSTSAHPSQVRGRDKFLDILHPWMPPPLPSWRRAMHSVDRSDKARPGRWGYWILEPGLLLAPRNPARLQRYLMNWLRALPVWLYMLGLPSFATAKLPTQVWRDFLHGVPDDPQCHTRNGKRAYEIKQIFGRVFADQQLNSDASGSVQWHGRHVELVDDHIGPLIIWETFQLGFRFELLALDRALRGANSQASEVESEALLSRIFPEDSSFSVISLPQPDTPSLFASLPHHRIPSLNALHDVVRKWPLCPSAITEAKRLQTSDAVDTIVDFELRLACFYTQTFFDVAGRAPIVPHHCPPEVT